MKKYYGSIEKAKKQFPSYTIKVRPDVFGMTRISVRKQNGDQYDEYKMIKEDDLYSEILKACSKLKGAKYAS